MSTTQHVNKPYTFCPDKHPINVLGRTTVLSEAIFEEDFISDDEVILYHKPIGNDYISIFSWLAGSEEYVNAIFRVKFKKPVHE